MLSDSACRAVVWMESAISAISRAQRLPRITEPSSSCSSCRRTRSMPSITFTFSSISSICISSSREILYCPLKFIAEIRAQCQVLPAESAKGPGTSAIADMPGPSKTPDCSGKRLSRKEDHSSTSSSRPRKGLRVLLTAAASPLNFSTLTALSLTGRMVPAPATQPPGQPIPSSR